VESSAHIFGDDDLALNWWPDNWVWDKKRVANIPWDWFNVIDEWSIWIIKVL
jgi:hypothetical protein